MISQRTLLNLEYDKLLDILKGYVSSSNAKIKVQSLRPSTKIDDINASLCRIKEAWKVIFDLLQKPYLGIDNLEDVLSAAQKNAVLSLSELLCVGRLLSTSHKLKNSINSISDEDVVLLKEDCYPLYENLTLEKNISEWILNETEIADKASDKLYSLRRKIRQTNENIKTKIQHYVVSNQYQKFLQDAIVTVRNGRYVIPLKTEFKGSIAGLIHDQSSSGATLFVEPFPIVELNNELITLYAEEKAEVERIIAYLSSIVSENAEELQKNVDIISDIDVVFAKAQYAYDTDSVFPAINDKGYTCIKEGRHPLIDAKKVVPVSLSFGENYNILLVTGANTGGKTVTLKMTGLITLMAMSGMYIPAEEGSAISVFKSIFSDIGDEQSIQQSLSTFSAHITNISEILRNISSDSLVLLDELGAGTDPTEGAALAISITEKLLEVGAKAIITTHYSELKAFSFSTQGIENASMEFDPVSFAPTYKLNIGMPGASNALNIAKRLGLDEDIVTRARSYISEDKVSFEDVLLDAESVKIKATNELVRVEQMKAEIETELTEVKRIRNDLEREKEKINENAQKKAKKIIEDYIEEAEEIIEKLKEQKNINSDSAFFEATKLNKRLGDLRYKNSDDSSALREYADTPISVGDVVYVNTLGGEAKVVKIKQNGECVLKVGAMELTASMQALKKVKKDNFEKQKNKVHVSKPLNTDAVSVELNVIGQTREECLYNVEYFIDKAILNGMNEVRIVHGVGMGILKKAVHEYLRQHKGVKSFRLGRYGEGDNGVTIVDLSK